MALLVPLVVFLAFGGERTRLDETPSPGPTDARPNEAHRRPGKFVKFAARSLAAVTLTGCQAVLQAAVIAVVSPTPRGELERLAEQQFRFARGFHTHSLR